MLVLRLLAIKRRHIYNFGSGVYQTLLSRTTDVTIENMRYHFLAVMLLSVLLTASSFSLSKEKGRHLLLSISLIILVSVINLVHFVWQFCN